MAIYWFSNRQAKERAENKVSEESDDVSGYRWRDQLTLKSSLIYFEKGTESCDEIKLSEVVERYTMCELSNHCSPKRRAVVFEQQKKYNIPETVGDAMTKCEKNLGNHTIIYFSTITQTCCLFLYINRCLYGINKLLTLSQEMCGHCSITMGLVQRMCLLSIIG